MNLLDLSAEELKNMDKKTVHDGYKKIMSVMLMDFYIDCSNHFDEKDITLQDLTDYIAKWVDKKITKEPQKEWNAGDSGK